MFYPQYRSAFEADQACHFEISTYQDQELTLLGCDHDLETRQWILFEEGLDSQPAEVMQRFRY